MDPATHLSHLRLHGDRLAAAAALAGDDRPVPSCPGWTMGQLVAHAGGVLAMWRLTAQRPPGSERVRFREVPRPAEGEDLVAWFAQGLDATIAALGAVDPAEVRDTFLGPRSGAFLARRSALEIAVHGWDAQGAVGRPEPFDPALAADGIDELLGVLAAGIPGKAFPASTTIHLHATDDELDGDDGEWLVHLDADAGEGPGVSFTHGHAKGAVAVRGTASDLYLLAWNRVPADDGRFAVFGDPAALDLWRTHVAI
ncbi:MAG: maleylpyruvate isomerase family mycothiol-dependent enzyme [Acidimicrobiia bacterium]